ncbi:MAG: hydroxyacid dehydrogenase [Pseudomonadota bacterium]
MRVVLLTEPIDEAGRAMLAARGDVEIVDGHGLGADEMAHALARAHAIAVRVMPLPAELLAAARRLEVVAKHGVGVDNIDVAHCTARGIPVANTPGANAIAVAEHAMMLMLALAKDALRQDRAVRGGNWSGRLANTPFELHGRTLLVIGFGRSGQELARRARAFGMCVLAAGRSLDAGILAALEVEPVADWRAALPAADVVSINIPRPAGAGHMIGAAELAAMRRGALLVNCARGGIVDEAALAAALRDGQLAGAGLDVLGEEPPRADNPLLGLDNVMLSPHVAGNTGEAARRMAAATAANVLAAFDGRLDPACVVNRAGLAARSGS